ncbi:MAG: helical backbone metal receptor [Actinomycetota bacterium]
MRPHRPLLGAALVLSVSLVLHGCVWSSTTSDRGARSPEASLPSAFPVTMSDDDGVRVRIDAPPRRIVTFAPSATEIVFALGIGDRLVGVSGAYDDYPPAATRIPEVGGAGDFGVEPNVEKVVSLRPDLFLTIEGGDQWKERLRELGIPVFTIDSVSLEDTLHDIETVGRLTGTTEAAERLVASMQTEYRRIEAEIAGEARVSCFFEVFYPPLTTVGPDTFIADVLRRAGCDLVSADARSDYPAWSVDDLVREDPEVYLVSSESGTSTAAVGDRPGFGAVAAVSRGDVALVDSDLVSRPGPRIVDGLRELVEALHPGMFG